MAFSLTYNSILRQDVKHTYSGLGSYQKQRGKEDRSLLELQRIREAEAIKSMLITRQLDNKGVHVPRAPAFSSMSREELEKSVERLRKPTVASKGESRKSEEMAMRESLEYPRFLGLRRSRSAEDIRMSTNRLSSPSRRARQTETAKDSARTERQQIPEQAY